MSGAGVGRQRVSEDQYYLNIAREVAGRATCLRRKFGAVIVKNKQIISTGYCGAPRGTLNCCDVGWCLREELGAKRGEHYEWCRSVHGEANAIIHAARLEILGATLYLVGLEAASGALVEGAEPCRMCKRMIINAGIEWVVVGEPADGLRRLAVADWIANNLGEFTEVDGRFVPVISFGTPLSRSRPLISSVTPLPSAGGAAEPISFLMRSDSVRLVASGPCGTFAFSLLGFMMIWRAS